MAAIRSRATAVDREPGADCVAAAGAGPDSERAAVERDALLHADQAVAAGRRPRARR